MWTLKGAGKELSLRDGEMQIGRAAHVDIVLEEAGLSRRHTQLLISRDEVRVRDLGSGTGTFVNGERVREVAVLRAGDVLRVGTIELTLGNDGVEPKAVPVDKLTGRPKW